MIVTSISPSIPRFRVLVLEDAAGEVLDLGAELIALRTGYLSTILRSDNPTSVSFSYIVGWDGEVILLVLDGTQ